MTPAARCARPRQAQRQGHALDPRWVERHRDTASREWAREATVRPALQTLNRQVDNLGGMLERKGGMTLDQANAALVRLNAAAENLGQLLNAENRQHMTNMLKNGEQASGNLGQMLNTENRQHLSGILKNGDEATEKVNQTLNDFKRTEAEISSAMRQTQTILSNLERASRNMNELSRQLRESPSAIFSSPLPADPLEAKK